jgi:hypothetical protein
VLLPKLVLVEFALPGYFCNSPCSVLLSDSTVYTSGVVVFPDNADRVNIVAITRVMLANLVMITSNLTNKCLK